MARNLAATTAAAIGVRWGLIMEVTSTLVPGIYPDFSVVVPRDMRIKGPTGFALPLGQGEMKRYFDTWLELAEKNGLSESLYAHWILGRDETRVVPRWSIMKDVLGWGASERTSTESQ